MSDTRGMPAKSSLLIYLGSLGLLATWAFLPSSWASYDGSDLKSITILSLWIPWALGWGSLGVSAVLFVLGLISFGRPTLRFPAVALLIPVLALPVAGLQSFITNFSPWSVEDSVTDGDGETYVFCYRPGLVGSVLAIGRLDRKGLLGSRYDVYVCAGTDSPCRWASIIRADDSERKDDYQLKLTKDRILVDVTGNVCYVAYDLDHGVAWDFESIHMLWPFVCLDADDDVYEPDVRAIKQWIERSKPGDPGVPEAFALRRGLEHPNPRVREIAAELLALLEAREDADE